MTAPKHDHDQVISHVRPQPLRPLPVGVAGVGGKSIDTGDWYLAGWSFRETTGTTSAQFDLFDGNDGNGILIASISLAAGESTRDTIGGHLLTVLTGLFLVVNSGTITGTVWVADRGSNLGPRRPSSER